MNQAVRSQLHLSENGWRGIILVLSCAVILVSIWSLTHEITSLFLQLYYFPMVLLTYRYRWKGFGLATLLGLVYVGLVIVFNAGQTDAIIGGLARFLVFVGISAVIAYLADHLATSERTLQQSAEIKDRYLSLAPAIILVLDRNGAITYLNKKGGEIIECLPDEVSGKNWADMFLPDKDRDRVKRVFSELITGQVESNRVFENPITTCGGTEKIIRWHNTVVHDENGTITGTLGFGEDITEEKWAQDTLREMQQFQESVITNANVWISVMEPDGTLLIWNDAAETISGYKKTGVLGKRTIWKQLYPDNEYRKKITAEIRQIIGRDTILEDFETDIRCADGTKKTVIWNSRGLRDKNGTITSYITIGRDVTAQKSAESRAVESSRFLATMINTIPTPIFFKDAAGKYLGCNPPYEEYIGIKSDSLIGKTAYDIAPKDLADKYTAADRRIFDNPVPQRYETQVQHADGTRHDVIFYKAPFLNKDGSLGGLIGTFLDITDRKRIEEALKESESFNRNLVENLPDYVAIYGMDGKLLYVNPASARTLGYDADRLIGTHVLSYIAQEYHETVIAKMAAHKEGSDTSPYEIEMVPRTGPRRSVIVKATPIQYKNNPAILLHLIDITERRTTEKALQESEEKFRLIVENSHDIIYTLTIDGVFNFVSPAWTTLLGHPVSEVKGQSFQKFVHPDDIARCIAFMQMVIGTGQQQTGIEYRVKHIDGTWRWHTSSAVPIKDKTDRIIGGEGIARDITERKQMEKQINESGQLFADIISFLPDPTFVIDKEGKVLAWNRAIEQLSGVPAHDIIGKGDHEYSLWITGKRRPVFIDLVLNPDQDYARMNYTGIQWDGQMVAGQYNVVLPDGRKTVLSLVASPLFDVQGNLVGAIESIRDITRIKETEGELARLNENLETIVKDRTRLLEDEVAQRKQAEKDVQTALDYTRSVIEANPDLMVVLDAKGIILDVNAAGELLTGTPKEKLIGSSYFGYLVEDGTHFNKFSSLLHDGKLENFVELKKTDGHITPLSVHAIGIRGKEGGFDRFIVAAHDITRQKRDEEAIRASLDEKVVLLREVHHRVKNNLQIIISLVNLQMRQTDDPTVKQIMSETQNRVRAMSLVHEKLYRSDSLSRIDFAEYTRYLATQLISFYGTDSRNVRLNFAMSSIMVDINTAVPLGLLMNELISNSLKHAFPKGMAGTISISGGYEGECILLVIRDNGVGIPPGFDWRNTSSLGMRLVISLIDQVDGTIELDRKNGTTFTITVKKNPINNGEE